MLYNSTFITMALANLFAVSSFGAFFLFPLYIINHGGSKSDIGIIMGIFALSAVLCRPWISNMVDRIGRKRSYTVGCVIITILPLLYLMLRGSLSEVYLPLLFLRVIHGVGVAICFTAAFTYIADIVPPDRLNEGIGMFGVTGLIGLAIGPVVAEIIIGRFGFDIFFFVTAGMAAMGLVLHLPLRESYRRSAHESSVSFFSVMFRQRSLTVVLLAALFGFGLSAAIGFISPFRGQTCRQSRGKPNHSLCTGHDRGRPLCVGLFGRQCRPDHCGPDVGLRSWAPLSVPERDGHTR